MPAVREAETLSAERAASLLSRHGSPLYVYDAGAVRAAYRAFVAAFPYRPLDVHYAIVCNKNRYLVRALAELGAGVHASTPGDAHAARAAGVPADRIVYSGSNLDARDFDYVVGSVHFIREGAVDMDDYSAWTSGRSVEEIWRRYFQTIGEAAASGLFDVLAHPDLVKYWSPTSPKRRLPEGDLRRYYELAIEGIAQSGIAVEVSTAGLRKRAGEIYPAPAFLEMCLHAGAPVALSSDAHRPEDVGADYDQALELLERLGVSELSVFDRRVRRLEPVGAGGLAGSTGAPPR